MKTLENNITETVRELFPFTVDKFPLSGPEGMKTPLYGLFRSDSAEIVGTSSVTRKYVPHTTDDVLALVEATATVFGEHGSVKARFNDGHDVVLAPNDEIRRELHKSESVFPRLHISAGYDGQAFKVNMGIHRDMCDNLMMFHQVEGVSVSIRHTSGLRSKMDELIQSFDGFRTGWNNINEAIDAMKNREVHLADFLNGIYGTPEEGASNRTVGSHRRRTESIFNRLQKERIEVGVGDIPRSNRVSAWEAFNAVQGYVQHDATRKGNVSDLDRALIAAADPKVKKAERMAMAIA